MIMCARDPTRSSRSSCLSSASELENASTSGRSCAPPEAAPFFFQAEDGIRDRDVTWSSDVCSSDLDAHLEAHASTAALGQILDVLLDNALRHGRGVVQLSLRRGVGGGAVISVEDDGPGVSGDAASVFSTSARGGHGFGLPLAAALADAEGARFRLARGGPGPVFELAVR